MRSTYRWVAESDWRAFCGSASKKGAHMRQQPGHRHSIFCILPPHVLRDIARTGTEEQREAALDTLAADSTFRTLRAIRQAAPVATASPAAVTQSAEAGTGA